MRRCWTGLVFARVANLCFLHIRPPIAALVQNGEAFLVHVHLLPVGADETDSMRFLRSCLRSDAELARAYVQHKQAIVSSGIQEQAEYCRQKAAFLKMVLG